MSKTAITFAAVTETPTYKASVRRAAKAIRKWNVLDNWAKKKRRKK